MAEAAGDGAAERRDPAVEVAMLAQGIDEALRGLARLPESEQRLALAAVRGIEALHQDGLQRLLAHVATDPRGAELLGEALADPVVRTMLAVHGFLEPAPPAGPPERLPTDPGRLVIRIDEPPPA